MMRPLAGQAQATSSLSAGLAGSTGLAAGASAGLVATTGGGALRELREESGCELAGQGRLDSLGYFLPSQGFTTEHVYLFRASPVCVVSRPESDGSEHISDVRFVSAEELRRMIAENEITNALTLALYARMSARGMV